MKEPHSEGVANHADLESCAGAGDNAGRSVGRGTGGPPIEPRNTSSRVPTLSIEEEGHIDRRATASGGRTRHGRRRPEIIRSNSREH